MKRDGREKIIFFGTTLAYFLIALEVLFMITPFALYFYGVYGPVLDFLCSSRLTAWTTEFFLPHMVFVGDPLLIGISWLQALFVVGMILFLVAAVPLYVGRLTGRGVVTFGLYARIRHPQYLFLALSGLGLLLYWPRFIVLLFYLFMLFAYFFLARNEEWRMKREAPGDYESYMARTWMFLPGEPGGRIFRTGFGFLGSRRIGLFALVVVVFFSAVGGAFCLRSYTLHRLPQLQEQGMRLISVYPRPMQEVAELFALAAKVPAVQEALAAREIHLGYVMPGDFFLTGLILREGPRYSEAKLRKYPYLRDAEAQRHSGGLAKFLRLGYKYFQTIGTTRRVYDYERLVFVETLGLDGKPVKSGEVLDLGVRRYPALVVDIDAETREVLTVTPVSGQNAWGRLPMPNF